MTGLEEFTGDDLTWVALVQEDSCRIAKLSGFRKTHRVPDEINEHAAAFVGRIAEAELTDDLDTRFADFRRHFGFRRVEMTASDPDGGTGQIETPMFDYRVSVSQATDDPSMALWTRRLSEFRQPQKLSLPGFSTVFGTMFRDVEYAPPESIDVEALIDFAEEKESPAVTVDYDRAATWCRLNFEGAAESVLVTSDRMLFSTAQPCAPVLLLQSFTRIRPYLAGFC